MAELQRSVVLDALREVEDPEVPVNIVDLGLVQEVSIEGRRVRVTLAPTYAACPGRTYIVEQARQRLQEIADEVDLRWSTEPHWRTQLIQPAALAQMREFGVGIPEGPARTVRCPYCESTKTRLEREFGSAVCKSLFYCDDCRHPFEAMRGSW